MDATPSQCASRTIVALGRALGSWAADRASAAAVAWKVGRGGACSAWSAARRGAREQPDLSLGASGSILTSCCAGEPVIGTRRKDSPAAVIRNRSRVGERAQSTYDHHDPAAGLAELPPGV